jgi:hypothetical protein
MAFCYECFFCGDMPVLCCERILREFQADSPFRNCFSKKKSIAPESPFSKKKAMHVINADLKVPTFSRFRSDHCWPVKLATT